MVRTQAKGAFVNLDQRLRDLEKTSATLSLAGPVGLPPAVSQLNHSPQANFGYYHLSNALTTGKSVKSVKSLLPSSLSATSPPLLQTDPDQFGDLFERILLPIMEDLLPKLGADVGQLLKVLRTGSQADIIRFFVDLLTTLVDAVEDVIDILLVAFEQVVGQLEAALDADFNLPVLAALYEFVTGLMGEDESFTVINGFSFVASIVAVVTLGITGQKQLPQRNTPDMDFANPDFPSRLESIICGQVAFSGVTAPLDAAYTVGVSGLKQHSPTPHKLGEDWSFISGILGMISNLMSAIANGVSSEDPEVSGPARKAAFVTSISSVISGFPIPAGEDQPMNTWIQRICVWAASGTVGIVTSLPAGTYGKVDELFANRTMNGQTLGSDQAKGVLSLVAGVVALGMAIEIDVKEHADTLTWFSDLLGNLGSICTSIGDATEQPEVKVLAVGLTFYGVGFASADLTQSELAGKVFKRIMAPF